MAVTVVIPDLQGIPDRVDAALDAAHDLGASRIIQLGDGTDNRARQAEGDWYVINRLLDAGVELHIGNHEASVVSPAPAYPFAGVDATTEASRLVADLYQDGAYRIATAVGPTLITHAGLLEGPWTRDGEIDPTLEAHEIAKILNEKLENLDGFDPVISSIPIIRGGRQAVGGVLWADFGEHVRQMRMNQSGFKGFQIIGHTPNSAAVIGQRIAAIDTRNEHGVTIAYTEDNGVSWKYKIAQIKGESND